jgi:hypothetical protein
MDQDKPQQKSVAPDTPSAQPAKAKSTGWTWRIVVILIVVALFGWEALAFYGYQSSSENIAEAMQRQGDKPTVDEATEMIRGFPQRSSDEAYSRPTLTYRWRGLFMEYGGVRLSFDPDTNVVEVFEMGIPTREEEERTQMEYEPIPGDTTTGAPRPDSATTPMGTTPAEEAPTGDSADDATPSDNSSSEESDGSDEE